MQRLFVTYLATLILFQGIFFNSNILFEINELMEDFQLHKVKYDDDLTTFFSKHFGDLKESHKQQHQEEHKQHNHPANDLNSNIQVDFALHYCYFTLKNTVEIDEKSPRFSYSDLFSTFEKPKIFQPPRLA